MSNNNGKGTITHKMLSDSEKLDVIIDALSELSEKVETIGETLVNLEERVSNISNGGNGFEVEEME